ncbi:response regulator [Marinobacter sp. F4216]|uniref:response regulator n=1 Tax=Marinobacter sp. F4216 TaxID=2874281 RepID=UPI001CC17E78|nr:response regulator [Marinobacter sp. F4216]
MLTINHKTGICPRGDHILRHRCSPALTAVIRTLLLLFFLSALLSPVQASQTPCRDGMLILGSGTSSVQDLGGCLWYLEDPDQSMAFFDIKDRGLRAFNLHDGGTLNFGYTDSAYWVRLDMRPVGTAAGTNWILELALPLVDDVRLFLVRDGELLQQARAGYRDNWSERDLAVPNPTFRLDLDPGVVTSVYLRITNTNTFRLPLSIWHPDSYIEKISIDEAFRGVLLGAIFAILAYNLFVAVSVRERSIIYYVLYLVSAGIFIVTEQVHGIQLLESRPALLSKEYLHFQIIAIWLWGFLMARHLLETKERSPHLDTVIKVSLWVVAVTFVLCFFMPYQVAMEWSVIGSILISLNLIVVSYVSWRYYNPAAKSYFFAWTMALIGFGVYALTVMGVLPLNPLTNYSLQIGVVAQVILFSFALADQIKQVQGEALDWSRRALSNLKRYQSLFDNAIEGVFQMSPDRRLLTANPAMADLMGYASNEELLERNPDVLESCIADDELRRRVIELLESTGAAKGIEARYLNRDGEERWANLSLHTVYDSDGEPLYLEGTCIDLTETHQRRRIEREREQERLEKDLARNSAQAKSQFLANMSHEIRTPLAAIIGYGETLLDPRLSESEKKTSAETVVSSGRHLLDLVNDILDHSKIDANKLSVDIVSVHLPELLDEIRAFFAPRAKEKGLDFSIICEYPLPEKIRTDPTRLRQIIINLCGNALKFTEKGSISLIVRCDAPGERLIATIVDTGIGMKPEQFERLFDPFAQGSASISRQYGGTGLGLSISRRLAELLGGTITVSSTYGEGSEFEVSIRTGSLADVHFLRDASELSQRRRNLPMVMAPKLSGRILCAEDNEVNRRLVSLLVARTGAELVHVGNGAEALELALRQEFDLILMDIQMPVMNGRDATAALREAGNNTPVIALTANVMAEDIADYKLAGCNEHLAKPIDKQRFYEVLARYLHVHADTVESLEPKFKGQVLVAEDNEQNRQLMERLLTRQGLGVTTVSSGEEAVRRALSDSVQLILMDRHMPDMDGVAATRLLRQAGFRRPIVAFTAGDRKEIDALIEAGCEAALNKPVEQGHLLALLERYLPPAKSQHGRVSEDQDIKHLVRKFRRSLAGHRDQMEQTFATGDALALRSQVHQIKGTAGAMGYPRMTRQAGMIEGLLKAESPDWQRVRTELDSLVELIDQARAASESSIRD